ncbi:methyltransferase family protein [Haloactinopolyspora alba]|uniref:Methyltransferase family protein n=1 Tax=Haloactinopolyspora alba TaxID=648780 RepID=A0A2P8EGH2_9ACTN|nr:methyltransferase domain-containing protein [Haloactinopolyspora alba]PSL08550.1 methyltransferase family protein [Haloactinopolyspora alba]
MDTSYDELVAAAMAHPFEGWDFSELNPRMREESTSWSYARLARSALAGAGAALDLGTGGGELLSMLGPLPPRTIATEGWAPNVDVARRRLEPLGVEVVDVTAAPSELPVPDASMDVVLNKHEEFDPAEVARVLRPGGTFVTQQVGGRDLEGLNEALGAPPLEYAEHDLAGSVRDVERCGLRVTASGEEFPPTRFTDIGAVVLFLRIAPWQVGEFTLDAYDAPLRALHDRIRADDGFDVWAHRFHLVAERT